MTKCKKNECNGKCYTQADMVGFGTYLLSDERLRHIMANEDTNVPPVDRYMMVHDADFDNWKNGEQC